jgi:hypothetical protein
MQGVDFNDRLIATASDGGAVTLGQLAPGNSTAAQLAAQVAVLAQQLPPMSGGLWVALAPPTDAGLPGDLLRQLRATGYEVQGYADRATLLAAWIPDLTELAVLDLSRRQFSISVATRDADAAALRRHVPLPGGAQALQDAWLRLAAATLVQQTRFDPLHDQRHEAQLRAQLPALAASAQRDGQAQCELDTGTGTVQLALTRDQLATAAQPVLAPLARAMQALAAAHGDAVLLVPESLLEIPGIELVLSGARFARLCRAEDGLAARAASLLADSGAPRTGGVPYRTRVPVFTDAAPGDVLQTLTPGSQEPQAMATHVVFRGKVVPIPATGLVLGRDPGPGPALRLPEGLAGLSRRHCTLRRDGLRTQVIDHSSHGTFLDGARVRGRALLPAGGALRLGDPGIELPLVAIEVA